MQPLKVAFIKANWHSEIVSQVLTGFEQELESRGTSYEIKTWDVPGAFEMPLLAQRLVWRVVVDVVQRLPGCFAACQQRHQGQTLRQVRRVGTGQAQFEFNLLRWCIDRR